MTDHTAETSLNSYARIAGILFLILIVCGPFSIMYVPSRIIVPGDATATAGNIIASEPLFRIGIISDAIIFLTEIVLTVILYVLFKPVSKTLSLVAAYSRLAMAVIQGINLLFNGIALLVLSGADYLKVFEPAQLHALSLLALNAHDYGGYIWEAFFGFHLLVLAYLLFTSGYFPRILGILTVISSLGYLIDSFGNFLLPGYKETYAMAAGIGSLIGEFPFVFWLLFKGVKVQQPAASRVR